MWYVIIHLTFVVSAVMMGVLDRITSATPAATRARCDELGSCSASRGRFLFRLPDRPG